MLYLVILSLTCWTLARSQNMVPSKCTDIYKYGSTSPYEASSIAAIYQTFCSVRENISQCMDDNNVAMVTGNNPTDWAIGITFEKKVFDENTQKMCDNLPGIASDLECLKSHQNSSCASSVLSFSVPSIYQTYKAGNLTNQQAKIAVCGLTTYIGQCLDKELGSCSKAAKTFLADYYRVFSGNCLAGDFLGSLPPNMRDSAFISCAFESYSDMINNVLQQTSKGINMSSTDSMMELSFSLAKEMCLKTDEFSKCLMDRTKTTTNKIDQLVLQFINVGNIKKAMDLQCSKMDDFKELFGNTQCMADITAQTQFCGSIYYQNVFGRKRNTFSSNAIPRTNTNTIKSTSFTAQISDVTTYKKNYCPGLKGMVDCMGIPISRCIPRLSSLMYDMVNMLISDSCKALSEQGPSGIELNPTASIFIQCGMPLSSLISKEIAISRSGPGSDQDISKMIRSSMDLVCRNAKWYLSCVDERLPKSKNVVDKFFKEIIDFSDDVNREEIISEICNKHLQDVKDSIKCMSSKIAPKNPVSQQQTDMFTCVQNTNLSIWSVFASPAEMIKMDGNSIRSTFCRPIGGLIDCAKTNFGSCIPKLAYLFDRIPKAILRTDCGGERSDNNNPNSAVINKSKTIYIQVMFTFFVFYFYSNIYNILV